ncbi:16036_t:CDS:1 [Cetraspora pellucida]|uniref:16036_t:CDS:1 n=1 Tax=Cetraspora pellucida TaxID=1433469 RepID=A0A9N9AWJ0_9GLOM|nr:16036_t:CDS:1 [Cetraspora pellucida]
MNEYRNVLLIGRTGQGKSSLANIIINDEKNFNEEGKFDEVFKKGNGTLSQTKKTQSEKITLKIGVGGEIKDVNYRIIDTVGIDDTTLSKKDVLIEIAIACKKVRKGINQILFVCGENLTPQEIDAYNIIRRVLFDEKLDKDITKYITIIRTRFDNFGDEDSCKNDIQLLIENENKAIVEMIQSCSERVVHINNPPINMKGKEEMIQEQINLNKKICKNARKRVIGHLVTCEDVYKPESLDEINERIGRLLSENKVLQEQLDELQEKYNTLQEQLNRLSGADERSKEISFTQDVFDEIERRMKENKLKKQMDEMMKKIDEIKTSMHENENSIEIGFFVAIGRGLDKLTEMVIGLAGKALESNRCPIL